LVSSLGAAGHTCPSNTENGNQNTQTLLPHHFSFERLERRCI
jgi:hypothetical protein